MKVGHSLKLRIVLAGLVSAPLAFLLYLLTGTRPAGFTGDDVALRVAEVGPRAPLSEVASEIQRVAVAPSPSPAPRAIEVRVLGVPDDEPIAGAQLRFWSGRQFPIAETAQLTTDACGTSRVPPPDAPTHLAVEAEGWFPESILLEPTRADAVHVVRLRPVGRLRVRVLTEAGEPVERAFVQVHPSDESEPFPAIWPSFAYVGDTLFDSPLSIRSVTNAAGCVEIGYLPCDLSLRVSVSVVVPETDVVTDISCADRWREVEVRTPASGAIHGRIVWANGSPADVRVQALVGRHPEHSRRTSTDPNGDFLLQGLPLGLVRWKVDAPGEGVRVAEASSGPGTDVGLVELQALATLRGRMSVGRAGDRSCLADLQLRVAGGGRTLGRARPGPDGSFELSIPSGEHGYQVLTPQGVLAHGPLVVPGEALEIALDELGGALEVAWSEPVPWSALVLRDPLRGAGAGVELPRFSSLLTESPEGCTRVFPVMPGRYEVFARLDAGFEFLGEASISPGGTTHLQAAAQSPSLLQISVEDTTGAPIQGVPVLASPTLMETPVAYLASHGKTDSGGRVTLRVFAGEWSIVVLWPNACEPRTRHLAIRAGEQAQLAFQVSRATEVTGRVTCGGLGREAARVVAYPVKGAQPGLNVEETLSEAEGHFRFAGLAPGTWIIRASTDHGVDARSLGKELDIQGVGVDVDLELCGEEEPLRFFRDGAPLRGIERLIAVSPGRRLSRQFGRGQELRLELASGPHVFLVSGDETAYHHGDGDQLTYYATSPLEIGPGTSRDVVVCGRDIRVLCIDAVSERPMLALESVCGISLSSAAGAPLLTYADQGALRIFQDVPLGSVVRLESWNPDAGRHVKTIVVETALHDPIAWPPVK